MTRHAALEMCVSLLYFICMGARTVMILLAWAALAPEARAQLPALQRAVAAAEAMGVRTGVVVCDEQADVLYRRRAAEAFAPASNMKLLTAAVVLHGLGADFEFVTTFSVEGGELRVSASADPNWVSGTAHDATVVFAELAAALRRRGTRELVGVNLDAGVFTGPSRPSTWPQDQLYAYYCAPTGPFALECNTFVVGIERSGGRHARASLVAPQAGYPITGAIREVSTSKGATYGAIDEGGAVRVRGKFYRKSPRVEIKTSVRDPSRWYRDTLIYQLKRAGIRFSAGAPRADLGVVYRHRSPISSALRRMLEDSSNFDAEQCLRALGAKTQGDGSLAGGLLALRSGIESLCGRVPAAVNLADGSGLSKQNRLTPGLLAVAMYELGKLDLWDVLAPHLPVAGRTGTLKQRFRGGDLIGKVRAKTGWIRGASALSGVVEGASEKRWFAILMNYDRSRSGVNKDLKRLQEDIVAAVYG
ncbi:MAG: D-alanyl-D-alanine carboxypeptidase/D-alanyl-D-alanine-endopeptidase, partial [Planctomycetota bacterium]|nr:D-alanyl-D-alanine carboxypeptidase/D-alanyl-D-alanine-endopeptidase [Planctomycetota bacterium]